MYNLIKKELTLLGAIMCIAIFANAQSGYIDKYITEDITLTTIGSGSQSVAKPRDLDFKPNTNELWVANLGGNNGGSMVIFYDAGLPTQYSQYRKDSHTGHFKAYPSAFAFGDYGFFANTNEIKSTGGANSTFMGPALWSADTAIFARVFQSDWVSGLPLGSHYDMLHQSPFAMGIAHDSAHAYWVNDGHNGNICKYDFVIHHGPGYDDHSNGKIWRFSEVEVTRVPNIPSHMVLDKSSGWLYFIDGGSKTLKRMDTKSGAVTGTLNPPASGSEALNGYWRVGGATVEELDTYTTQPCGIDIMDNRLIVSDHTTGDIYLYSVGTEVTLIKTIVTGKPGIMGVKFGPDSKIWCVNNTDNAVYRLDISAPDNDVALLSINAPETQNFYPDFYNTSTNVCNNEIIPSVTIQNNGTSLITSVEFEYSLDNADPSVHIWTGSLQPGNTVNVDLPVTAVDGGTHLLNIRAIGANASVDNVTQNNSISGSFRVVTSAEVENFKEEFTSTTFPPAGWNYIHYNPNNIMSRVSAGGFGNSTGSLKMNNFSGQEDISGQIDYFMSPSIDFSAAVSSSLVFSVAYAQYSALTNDKLHVLVSTDCGDSWTTVYNKQGNQLKTTTTFVTSNFTPNASQWRSETVDLSDYAGMSNVIIMFAAINNFGNNLYIDDIKMENTLGNNTSIRQKDFFNVYPNPTNGTVELVASDEMANTNLTGKIYSFDGKLLQTFAIPISGKTTTIDLTNYPPGMYGIQLSNDENTMTKSIIKK